MGRSIKKRKRKIISAICKERNEEILQVLKKEFPEILWEEPGLNNLYIVCVFKTQIATIPYIGFITIYSI
jgi:uncharacterized Rmd1/YagE family protein